MAMSYDTVAVLATFAGRYGIDYPLLSDEGSRVIDELGLRNQHVAEQQSHVGKPVTAKHDGIPYPGTFMIDEAGVLTGKRFQQSHRIRPSGISLLADIAGAGQVPPKTSDEFESSGVRVAGWLGSHTYRPLQVLPLQLSIDIPDGLHIYGAPTPPGFAALNIALHGDGIVPLLDDPPLPAPRSLRMQGLRETFFVYEGRMELEIPFALDRGRRGEPVEVTVTFQACSHELCHAPTNGVLRFPLVEKAL